MALKTVNNYLNIAKITRQSHEVAIPPLCPKTGNPIGGSTITITYTPQNEILEVYSLTEHITSFAGSSEVRDIEHLVQVVARDCHEVLGVRVMVTGKFVLNIGQTVICECWR